MFSWTEYDSPRRRISGTRPRLPIRMLLATRGDPRLEEEFNLVGLVRRILGSHEDERAARVMLPFIYAGNATDESIAALVNRPWLEPDPARLSDPRADTGSHRPVAELRLPDFPLGAAAEAGPGFDIVHFVDPGLMIDDQPHFPLDNQRSLTAGALCDALVAMRCRLLILQSHNRYWAEQLARWTVGAGGPSVLTVDTLSPIGSERFFVNFYLGLLHNEGLRNEATWVDPFHEGVEARLHLAEGADEEWRFDWLRDGLKARAERFELSVRPFRSAADDGLPDPAVLVHASDRPLVERWRTQVDAMTGPASPLAPSLSDRLDGLGWHREADGVVPLTEIEDDLDLLEMVEMGFREAVLAPAPRVLNANFAGEGRLLEPHEPLRPGRRYDLLVDIGPQWDRAISIVEGHSAFPTQALPASADGHRIEIVFASDGFAEPLVAGALWLPDRGRSVPIVDGRQAEAPGPLRLPLTTPSLEMGTRTLHGRLCLFHGNNLLQSAVVRAILSATDAPAEASNSVTVDFVLSGGFHDVESLRTRRLEAAPADTGRGELRDMPVGFNITLNDDGGGTHRLILPSLGAPVSVDYDPDAAKDVLARARRDLLNLFWKRDAEGAIILTGGTPIGGLDDRNGKDRPGFLRDLLTLANTGSRLFAQLFSNVRPSADRTAAQLMNDVRAALARGTVVQIARTGSANYVFPWSLVYDFPIDEKRPLKFCPVVREWDEQSGRRTGPHATACPHGDHHAHDNLLCPYGFWGVRHNIEQPPSGRGPGEDAPWQAPRRTGGGGNALLQAAVTRDAALDGGRIAAHLHQLSTIQGFRFAPPAAADWTAFIPLLKAPQLLYFLCHGEYDPARREPYLGIGLRDADAQHRIYANDIAQAMLNGVDQDYWQRNAPLILINGCHTADLEPGQIWNFVQSFTQGGAGGVIGTEVSVRLPVATEAAELLLETLGKGEAVGDAIRAMRWAMLDKGNLLGLAYTPYCLADLRLAAA
ncbi:MAG TPA: CHAT domain-containing protein [Allosphingosinicella sp.]|nr:CHAT domain-containing protein [Allosphingosinicella sp.]